MSAPTLRELKSRAQLSKPLIKLGKAGASAEFLAELEKLLDLHGLVKLRFEGFKDERKTLSKDLAEKTGATLVQQVGHTAVYYRSIPPIR
jgi:RNA-binding protein